MEGGWDMVFLVDMVFFDRCGVFVFYPCIVALTLLGAVLIWCFVLQANPPWNRHDGVSEFVKLDACCSSAPIARHTVVNLNSLEMHRMPSHHPRFKRQSTSTAKGAMVHYWC